MKMELITCNFLKCTVLFIRLQCNCPSLYTFNLFILAPVTPATCEFCGVIDWLKFLYCDPKVKSSIIVPPSISRPCYLGLAANECLIAGDGVKINSCFGCFYFELTSSGNLEVHDKTSSLIWSTNTANQGVAKACLEANGNFALVNGAGNSVWQSNTGGNAGAYVEMQYDGLIGVWANGKQVFNAGLKANCS